MYSLKETGSLKCCAALLAPAPAGTEVFRGSACVSHSNTHHVNIQMEAPPIWHKYLPGLKYELIRHVYMLQNLAATATHKHCNPTQNL